MWINFATVDDLNLSHIHPLLIAAMEENDRTKPEDAAESSDYQIVDKTLYSFDEQIFVPYL